MPILQFTLSNFQFSTALDSKVEYVIRYDICNHSWDDELKFRDGSNLLKIPSEILIRSFDESMIPPETIGVLHYVPAYEGSSDGVISGRSHTLSLSCIIPTPNILQIFEAEKGGFGPNEIFVTVEDGIGYGVSPDVSDKVWTADKDFVRIQRISFKWDRNSES